METKEVTLTVLLNGNVMANCAGLDVALLTLEGIMNKVKSSDNFVLTMHKQTIVRTEPDKKVEDGATLMSDKENNKSDKKDASVKEEVKPENPVKK